MTRRATICVALVLALLLGRASAFSGEGSELGEYQVKAAFLFNFLKFVKWSANALPEDTSTIGVCVLAGEDVARTIDGTIGGKAVRDKQVIVRRLPRAKVDPSCQILFLSGDAIKDVDFLRSSTDAGVLTVGDADGFAARGAVIAFRLEDGRVRFDINPDAAKRAHLEVSSQLLKLANIVHDEAAR